MNRPKAPILLTAVALVLSACGSSSDDTTTTAPSSVTTSSSETSTTVGALPEEFSDQEIPAHLSGLEERWETDFTKATVDLNEILVGIPAADPRDLIPPIDEPDFAPVEETTWLSDREPGVLLEIEGDARFYPLAIMTRHEIVNDEVAGMPVAVTYCPLCNTAVTFSREFEGDVIRLGVSGLLRNSDLVMWDDRTESLWQQITGRAIVGEDAGKRLELVPSAIVRWGDFKERHPGGQALTQSQGFGINYGVNPYVFYSSRPEPLSFFQGETDGRFPALERVVGISIGESSAAYPFPVIQEEGAVNDELEGTPIVVFWGSEDTADALDASRIAEARAVGTGVAYNRIVDGMELTFTKQGEVFVDDQTGTEWDILGVAISGELEGSELDLIAHRNEFWFAWDAFFPDSRVYGAETSSQVPTIVLASADRGISEALSPTKPRLR